MKKGNKKSKKIKKTTIINNKNIKIVLSIVIIIIIILIIRAIINNKKQNESANLQMSEFEKIGVYNYIEENFLDSNLLNYLEQNDSTSGYNTKLDYAIAYTMKKNNTKKASTEEVRLNYMKIFGINISDPATTGSTSSDEEISWTPSYKFNIDEKTNSYVMNENINIDNGNTNNYNDASLIMKITSIEQNIDKENIVKIDILSPNSVDEFINYYLSQQTLNTENIQVLDKLEEYRTKIITNAEKNQIDEKLEKYLTSLINDENREILTQKVATGELKIKINNGVYVPESFTTKEVQD